MLRKMKDFVAWLGLKQKLDALTHEPPFVSERDVWWAAIGENIGSEIGGKSNRFSRPVIILKKLSHGFYFVAPTTSQKREGTWYVPIVLENKEMYVCLHHVRTIDHKRLFTKIGQLDDGDFARIRGGFTSLYW